jgi:quercetin dioxygenase-like cupin family protein
MLPPTTKQEEITMERKFAYRIATGLAGFALAFGLGIAVGQQTPPTETKGVKISPPTALDLSQEIDGMQGRQLRMRVVTIEPGGVVAVHSHKGRPAVAYVVQGTVTESRVGAGSHEWHEGESWTEDKDTTHWAENKGDGSVVIVAVDIFKP